MAWAFSIVRAQAWRTRPRTKCKYIDDMLEEYQNDPAEVQFHRVPAILDSLAAITRAITSSTLQGLPNDLASTYRQDTAGVGQAHPCAAATWSSPNQCVVFGLTENPAVIWQICKLGFFCRFPTWCFCATACLHNCFNDPQKRRACRLKSQQQRRLPIVHGGNLHRQTFSTTLRYFRFLNAKKALQDTLRKIQETSCLCHQTGCLGKVHSS